MRHGYFILFAAMFAHQVGLPVPGPMFLLAAGALAATGKLGLVPTLGLSVIACVLADLLWYEAGRRRGIKVIHFIHRLSRDPHYHDRKAQETFARYGCQLLLVAKFVPGLGAVTRALAGTSHPSRVRFLAFDTQHGCNPVQVAGTSCAANRIRMMTTPLVVAAVTALGLGLDAVADSRNANATVPSSPQQLVATTIANELEHAVSGILLVYITWERDGGKSQARRVVETPNGDISMTIAQDERPLSPEELRDQEQQLLKLVNNPAAWAAHRRKQQRDHSEENTLVRSIPDAFVFQYAGIRADGNGQIVTLHFSPNTDFHPPSRESQVFQGLRGVMEISLPAARIVRIEGTLFQPVNFGWGILGHLNSGGRFLIEQAPVGNGRWEMTHMVLRFTGKVINEESRKTDFEAIPSLSLADAVHFAAHPK